MKIQPHVLRLAAVLASAVLLGASQRASAVQLDVYVSTISQFGTGSGVNLGHTVLASTPYNRLIAGGTFTAACNHSATLPLTGERTLPSETYGFDQNILYVTIPETVPALRNMPGFGSVERGTELSCTYRWTARAIEGGYTIGIGGISFVTGNGERTDGGTVEFKMVRPDPGYRGCIIP